jgi:hypothetical protein
MTRRTELGDWLRFDALLATALTAWRRRSAELAQLTGPLDIDRDFEARLLARSPIPEVLIHEEARHELKELRSDPVALSLSEWVETLWLEDALYDARVAVAVAWSAPREVRGRSAPTSLRELRRETLGGRHPNVRARAAEDLQAWAQVVAEPACWALERRLDLELRVPATCRSLAVAELPAAGGDGPDALVAVAERWLDRTEDLAAESRREVFEESLVVALAPTAREGWPVRPSMRWMRSVFAREDWTRGMSFGTVKVPAPLGATSYARALGSFGVRFFEASRPSALPLAVHQHPQSLRKHEFRALFSSIVAEPSFAMRTLGLTKGRAREHSRTLARSFLMSCRIDALRVLVGAAAREGLARGRERQAELSERVLGAGLGASFLGVLPTLRPGDGAAFAGMLRAAAARRELIERHDDDWYRNPRALFELRDRASRPEPPDTADGGGLAGAAASLAREFETAIS